MATITITRDLTKRSVDKISTLIPVFVRNSIAFRVVGLAAEILGSYATVKIGDYEFRAVKTILNDTTHIYNIDLTSTLINMMQLDLLDTIEVELLTKTQVITIKLYSSAGVFITSINHPSIKLGFIYSNINTYSEVDIYKKGSSMAIYHNGKFVFFWSGGDTVATFNVGLSSDAAALNGGEYTLFNISATSLDMTGTLTSPDLSTFSIPIYYKVPFGSEEIAWLNRDGAWSFWNFRLLTKELRVKKSNDVATYYPTNVSTISLSRQISAEKTVEYTFDTLAYDTTHFEQLCEIQESLAVIWNNKHYRVKSCNTKSAVCKQNLKFTLILEIDENIAGY